MLRYSFDRPDLDKRIQAAVSAVLSEGYRTVDIFEPGTKKVGTREMGEAVVAAVKRLPQ
jgi:3-isopropylmalate dehydrogenase